MEDLGAVSDDQVILAWLQAEIESPPFQAYLVGDPPKPSHLARALALARNADLDSAENNAERRRVCLRMPDGAVSLLEGHTRATAMVMEGHMLPRGVGAFVGESPSINCWTYL